MAPELQIALLLIGVVLLRAVWGIGTWFISAPESVRGWIARGGLLWLVVKAIGLA